MIWPYLLRLALCVYCFRCTESVRISHLGAVDKAPSLDGQYTIWGEVVSGMEHVDDIKKGSSFSNGSVKDPDAIISMRVAADVK